MSQLCCIRLAEALRIENARLSLLTNAQLVHEYDLRGFAVLQVPREGKIRDLLRYHRQDFMIAEVNKAFIVRPPVRPC